MFCKAVATDRPGGGYEVRCGEFPGVLGCGVTLDEAVEDLIHELSTQPNAVEDLKISCDYPSSAQQG